MAIKAYNSGTNNHLIDTTDRFEQGDMLAYNAQKNLFTTSIKLSDFATTSSLAALQASVDSLGAGQFATLDDITQKIAEAQLDSGATLDGYVQDADLAAALANYQPSIDLSAYYTTAQVDALIPTSFSGDYNDLTNVPTLPTAFSGDYADLINKPTTFSGNYADLSGQPNIPSISGLASTTYVDNAIANSGGGNSGSNITDISQLTDNNGLIPDLNGYVTEIILANELASYQPTVDLSAYALANIVPGDVADLTDNNNLLQSNSLAGYATEAYVTTQLASYQPTVDLSAYVLAADAFSGDYTDLTNKPTMFSGQYADLIGAPTIFSGNYADLSGQPIIPSINGLASEAWVAQQITNIGSGGGVDLSSYVTDTELNTTLGAYATTTSVNTAIAAIVHPTIPADVSDLTDLYGLINGGSSDVSDLTGYVTDAELATSLSSVLQEVEDLTTGYATETYVTNALSSAAIASISALDDLNDVAIDGTETTNHVLMYNAVNRLWENIDLDENFATRAYVTEQVAQVVSGGQLDLSGYVTENFLDQKLLERGNHFSGNYNDLVNRPNLFSGDYNDLFNAPAGNNDLRMQLVGQELQLINIEPEPDTVISTVDLADLGVSLASNISYNNLANLPTLFSGDYNDLNNLPVLFSGSYGDLANKPYIPSIAGLATEQYVNDKHAEPTIWGDKLFKGSITFEDFTKQKTSIVSHEASKRELVMAIQTTDAVPTEVLLSDSTRIAIAQNSTAMFKATAVCSSDTVASSFIVRGIVNHTASGNIQLVGTNILEILADSQDNWNVDLTADATNNSLNVTVTGGAATTIDWTLFVEITDVQR
ncbi:hypothetical protein N8072_00605 [bacterium]|nr:hypothetical protein [bacterium]MDB4128451.1 hypothetical protein [bacterium]MDC1257162.1 hypothetical protein [bacterium]